MEPIITHYTGRLGKDGRLSLTEKPVQPKYTKAGLVARICADTLGEVIDVRTHEGQITDKDVARLVAVARALAKLAWDEQE